MRAYRNVLLILATLILALAMSLVAQAEPPAPSTADVTLAGTVASKISYQGRLTDASGNPLTGTYNLVFQLWDAVTGGSQVGSDIVKNNVSVNNGLLTVDLDVPQSAFNGQALWLRIQVSGQWLSPRQELLPVPYALGLRPGAWINGNVTGAVITATNQATGAKGVAGIADNYSGIGVYGSGGFGVGVQGNGEMGVKGIGSVGAGIWGEGATGVYGKSAHGYGVWGATSAPMTATVAGVFGTSENAIGVMGTSITGTGGLFTSTHGTGAVVDTVEGYGLYAQSDDNIGIYGHSGAMGYPIYYFGHIGVFGIADGIGVKGLGGPTGGYFFGQQGVEAGGTMTGVIGTADNTGGRGVIGIADNYGGIGVSGSGGFGTGVRGNGEIGVQGFGSTGAGVWGEGATGVYGTSHSGSGVWGNSTSGHGVYASSQGVWLDGTALYAENPNTNQGMAAYILNNSNYHTAHFYNAGTGGGVLYLQNGGTDAGGSGGGDFITAVNKPRNDAQFRVLSSGEARSDVGFNTPASDFAEMLPAVEGLQPGDVLVIGSDGKLARSTESYQASVAGVYSTQPGFVGGQPVEGEVAGAIPLAVVGVVPVNVSAENGPIRPGDLLVTSSLPGYAMKAGPNPPQGTVIGKALEGLEAGTGLIKMLATLQ